VVVSIFGASLNLFLVVHPISSGSSGVAGEVTSVGAEATCEAGGGVTAGTSASTGGMGTTTGVEVDPFDSVAEYASTSIGSTSSSSVMWTTSGTTGGTASGAGDAGVN
jgi:hypothetical protein